MARPTPFPHQVLMRELKIKITELPEDIKAAIITLNDANDKKAGNNPELIPISELIASVIQDWWDEETDDPACPCFNPNIGTIYTMHYKQGKSTVTKEELGAAGFDTRLLNRRGQRRPVVTVGDYKLTRQGRGRKEIYKIERIKQY
ncbi:hypothetical protein BKI52_02755 [marine bacterium AO1-C]|nr:hypothetical protein BKI52_02755 [marine bacterium AO1-C]